MSVLAYVIDRGALAAEPAATQALAYILNSKPDIAGTFVGTLRDAGIVFEPGRIEAEQAIEKARPDLTIQDSDGRMRVFVENKFWAGLTPAQPVSYLDNLPEDPPSALLFIVPEKRVATAWDELKTRCSKAGLEWTEAPGGAAVTWGRVGCKTMMIASWSQILERLLDGARSKGHDDLARDILQLQGLANREDLQAFLPLRADEVTDQEVARRLINYSDLFDPIINELQRIGVANKKRFGVSHGPYHTGRFFGVYGKFQSWLGVHLKSWRDYGITPLWCDFKSETAITADHFKTNPELIAAAEFYGDGRLYVPIRLKISVERGRVVDDAVAQIKRVADHLLKTIPDN